MRLCDKSVLSYNILPYMIYVCPRMMRCHSKGTCFCLLQTYCKYKYLYIHFEWIATSPCHVTLHAISEAVAYTMATMAPLHRLNCGPEGSQRRPKVSNTLEIILHMCMEIIIPIAYLVSCLPIIIQTLPKCCPKDAQKLS